MHFDWTRADERDTAASRFIWSLSFSLRRSLGARDKVYRLQNIDWCRDGSFRVLPVFCPNVIVLKVSKKKKQEKTRKKETEVKKKKKNLQKMEKLSKKT